MHRTKKTPLARKRKAQWSFVFEVIVLRHCGHNICDGVKRNGKTLSGSLRASQRLKVARCMVMSVIGDGRSATKTKYMDRDFIGVVWPDVATGGIPVKKQGHKKKESVRGMRYVTGVSKCGNSPEKFQLRRHQFGGARLTKR